MPSNDVCVLSVWDSVSFKFEIYPENCARRADTTTYSAIPRGCVKVLGANRPNFSIAKACRTTNGCFQSVVFPFVAPWHQPIVANGISLPIDLVDPSYKCAQGLARPHVGGQQLGRVSRYTSQYLGENLRENSD